ncbi:hypothetical protein FE257_000265 [Aspergillus nanangensis]|uniref:BZIP domain-containing protein n=1 Tax=Aspergillus nanangensis TaxID=2582783 RepID=A0AAD4GZV9_ASPNN|nr:hypothetical protein FE257_000265 [Aspergillus nanangensis]
MGSEDSEKKSDRLARIRENQRKSRARKQEHIRELEQKLAFSQEQAHHKDVEHRLTVQRLEAENRKLRNILSLSGLPSSVIERYLLAADNPAVTQKVAIPALRNSEAGPPPQCKQGACSGRSVIQNDSVATHSKAMESPTPPKAAGLSLSPKALACGPSQHQSICVSSPSGSLESWPINDDVLNTTLCAIADELILQYNTRGLDMEEIRRKLWAGFSKGITTEEGCRVQNHVLFQVLDEISNN